MYYFEVSNMSNADPTTLVHLSRDFLGCGSPGVAASSTGLDSLSLASRPFERNITLICPFQLLWPLSPFWPNSQQHLLQLAHRVGENIKLYSARP